MIAGVKELCIVHWQCYGGKWPCFNMIHQSEFRQRAKTISRPKLPFFPAKKTKKSSNRIKRKKSYNAKREKTQREREREREGKKKQKLRSSGRKREDSLYTKQNHKDAHFYPHFS